MRPRREDVRVLGCRDIAHLDTPADLDYHGNGGILQPCFGNW
jgi:hypothetical protein